MVTFRNKLTEETKGQSTYYAKATTNVSHVHVSLFYWDSKYKYVNVLKWWF